MSTASESTTGLQAENQDDDATTVPMLLITANVGSLFEDPSRLLQPWIREFLAKVAESRARFVALHLQEVGGKTYEKSMECVQNFIQYITEASEMEDFAYIRVYMDEDFNSAEHFTALGNLYFVHKNIRNVRMWNFLTHEWEPVDNKSIYSGNIETIPSKEKSKFPQHFFPECKWSRKGFMRTRWDIESTVFDLVNIHLFHDASNLAASEEFPSVYCKTRRRALVYTLERFHLDEKNGCAPYFLFGDFNFRCDTGGVIKELTENLTAHRVQSIKSDSTKVHYRNSVGNNVLTIGKKEFNHADHQLKFKEVWLKKFDRELEVLKDILVEYDIEFPPSYPYEEDPEMPTDYMSTRCPSWCDRILMSPQARDLCADHRPAGKNPYHMIDLTASSSAEDVPVNLRQLVQETLSEDAVWKEQAPEPNAEHDDTLISHSNIIAAKSQYVQINAYPGDLAGGLEEAADEAGGPLDANAVLATQRSGTAPILKETTV